MTLFSSLGRPFSATAVLLLGSRRSLFGSRALLGSRAARGRLHLRAFPAVAPDGLGRCFCCLPLVFAPAERPAGLAVERRGECSRPDVVQSSRRSSFRATRLPAPGWGHQPMLFAELSAPAPWPCCLAVAVSAELGRALIPPGPPLKLVRLLP